jgi:hypothetical protein
MGDTPFSLATMVQFVVIIVVVMLLARATRRALLKRVLPRTRLDDGLQYMISGSPAPSARSPTGRWTPRWTRKCRRCLPTTPAVSAR